ncbi:H-type small acid-soluble spore protein [Salibacterium salarium]|uniref:Small, acid-soluble spore protein H n=2 Tax=Salibacterium salarium TaxID=284579 RepID=A0A3R9QMF3_9BACI|nr:H-type small acid-soluble spore protein [Salibacterium salarium]RSL34073.1 H-type small acid-soluble spore protein [Salibacterium salarium]
MDVLRAQKISESPVMGNVTYDGTPIYIQHVDNQNETARIYALEDPDNELTVSIDSLEEK